jgi:glycolate oxidase iron-sulfur subunit
VAAEATRTYVDLISDCVHCGFCLSACPTYVSWGNEADSPRGRIDLMKGLEEGAISLGAHVVEHFDRCLGCMGCLTACPSGVRYDVLIEATRARIEARYRRPLFERIMRALVFAIFPFPKRLRMLAPLLNLAVKIGAQRLLPGGALLPEIDLREASMPLPETTPARGSVRARVGVITGCVQSVMFPNVNRATVRVLSAEGCEVIAPRGQGCCGALSLHAGRDDEAKRFARALIKRFEAERLDAIVINSAGCGSAIKQYGELLAGDPDWADRAKGFAARVRDVNEFLEALGPVAPRRPLQSRVAYHDACHLAHAQRIRAQPRALLRGIPGVELVEIPQGDQCCGSAGAYNIFESKSSREIGMRKVENVLATGAPVVASANPGCTLQLRSLLAERGVQLRIRHPIEILDESLNDPS